MRHSNWTLLFVCVLAVALISCSDDDIPTQPEGPFLITGVAVGKTISPVVTTFLTPNQNHNFIWDVAYTLNQTDKALLSLQNREAIARQMMKQRPPVEAVVQSGFELVGVFVVYDNTVTLDANGNLVGGNPEFLTNFASVPKESGVEKFNVNVFIPSAHPTGGTVLVVELLVDFFDFNQQTFRGVDESVFWVVQ